MESEQAPLAATTRPLVLIVDDDDVIRAALSDLLEDAGFDTIGARHGFDALTILAALAVAPAFIILDLMMPLMDGWTFCAIRRRSRAGSPAGRSTAERPRIAAARRALAEHLAEQ